MKKKIILSFVLLTGGFLFNVEAQTQFWSDTFEDAGAPSSGTRTPENNTGTGSPFTSYFARTNNAGISTQFTPSGGYQSLEGAKFWAGEDHDTPFGAGNEEQEINWTGINISGKTNLAFRGLFAANNISAAFENFTLSGGVSNSDYIIVEYRFNGAGAYTRLLGFFANNTTSSGTNNKSLALDTDANDVGDGTILTPTFNNFQANITGTGSTIDIRIRVYSNGGNEEWAIDNFRLLEGVLSTDQFEINKSFTVYPNPTNGSVVNIKTAIDGEFQIINHLGQAVKSFQTKANTINLINVDQLPNGVYFIKGVNGTKINTQKLIIKK